MIVVMKAVASLTSSVLHSYVSDLFALAFSLSCLPFDFHVVSRLLYKFFANCFALVVPTQAMKQLFGNVAVGLINPLILPFERFTMSVFTLRLLLYFIVQLFFEGCIGNVAFVTSHLVSQKFSSFFKKVSKVILC